MAYRYGLNFLTIHGLDPEGEPSPEDIIKVVEEIKEKGLTVIFVEEYTNNASLDSLRQETVSSSMPDGIQIKTLYTMEMPPKDDNDNYLTLMQKNLESLKSGLACS
jgi:zinc transport system substrate-binding protein